MGLKTTPDTYILESKFLAKFPRLRRVFDRLLIGSTGVEFWSAITFIILGMAVLTPPSGTQGFLLRTLGRIFPILALAIMVAIGAVHLLALSSRISTSSIAVRKVCTAIEVTAWTAIVWDMAHYGQTGSAVSLGVLVIMLYIAVARRKYIA